MASTKRYYVFYFEKERLWGDSNRRRVRVSKLPKEYLGPFDTRVEAARALTRDARRHRTPPIDYKVKHLTPAGFARAWG